MKVDRIFECRLCRKKFSSVGALSTHLRTHKSKSGSDTNRPTDADGPIVDGHANDGNGGDGVGDDSGDDDDENDNDSDDGENIQSRRLLFQGTLVRYRLKALEAEQQDLMYFFSNRRQQLRKKSIKGIATVQALKMVCCREDRDG